MAGGPVCHVVVGYTSGSPASISNLRSYIINTTQPDTPQLVVMITDKAATMPFGNALGVAALEVSPMGSSWIPSEFAAVPCPVGTLRWEGRGRVHRQATAVPGA